MTTASCLMNELWESENIRKESESKLKKKKKKCNLNLIFTEEKLLGSFDVCFNQGTRTGKGSKAEDERSGMFITYLK